MTDAVNFVIEMRLFSKGDAGYCGSKILMWICDLVYVNLLHLLKPLYVSEEFGKDLEKYSVNATPSL